MPNPSRSPLKAQQTSPAGRLWAKQPIDIRYVDGPPWDRSVEPTSLPLLLARADGALPYDPLPHTRVVDHASLFLAAAMVLVLALRAMAQPNTADPTPGGLIA